MSKEKKIIRNIIILAVFIACFYRWSGLYLNPMSAHEDSERSIHYGPSKVVHVENFNGGKYILCKYDKWVSCNTIEKSLFFFWRFGSQAIGIENDKDKAIKYTFGESQKQYRLYGIVNNGKIKKVEVVLNNGQTFTQTDFYDDLFLFTWKKENCDFKGIKGYDSNNNIVFEDKH